MLGFFVPLIWVASPAFSFAEYPLRLAPLIGGFACFVIGLWVFQRSHAALGTNWSVTLQIREDHRLVTRGVYRHVRHPMYSGLFLYSLGQALALPNWFVGPSYLVTFGVLFAFRLRAEERLMLEEFGQEYPRYMGNTKRLISRGLVIRRPRRADACGRVEPRGRDLAIRQQMAAAPNLSGPLAAFPCRKTSEEGAGV